MTRRLRLTQTKSGIGYAASQKETLRSLGLRRMHQTVEVGDTPSIRGMVSKVSHLLRVEEIEASPENNNAGAAAVVGSVETKASDV